MRRLHTSGQPSECQINYKLRVGSIHLLQIFAAMNEPLLQKCTQIRQELGLSPNNKELASDNECHPCNASH